MSSRETPDPVSAFGRHDLIPTFRQAEGVPNAMTVNLHYRPALMPRLAFYSRTIGDDIVACVLRNPMVIRTPVEEELCVRAVCRGPRQSICAGLVYLASRLSESCA